MKKLAFLCALALFASCSTTTKKEIEKEREEIGKIESEKEVIAKAGSILEKSNITEKQKQQFIELYRSNVGEMNKIKEQIREYRVVLLKILVDEQFSQRKFDVVANKIKKLVLKRYDLSMKQYREGKEILGVAAGTIYDDPWFEIIHRF